MAGRASYRRSQERAQDVKDWISDMNPGMDWDAYNKKFDTLSYYWPVFGDIRKAYDEIKDLKENMDFYGYTWNDVDSGKLALRLGNTQRAFGMVSKNIMRLYR